MTPRTDGQYRTLRPARIVRFRLGLSIGHPETRGFRPPGRVADPVTTGMIPPEVARTIDVSTPGVKATRAGSAPCGATIWRRFAIRRGDRTARAGFHATGEICGVPSGCR